MNLSTLIQQKQKGLKRTLVALLASAAMAWGSSVPAVAEIVNSVVASGFAKGAPIGASALEEVDVADQVATIILDKTAVFNDSNVNGSADVGETISYNFSIRNAGNVTLQNVVLVDDKVTPSNLVLLPAGDVAPLGNSTDTPAAGWASLAPGDTLNATATYSITLADLNAGQIINTARTDAATIPGLAVSSTDTVTTPLITSSSIALEKTASLDLGNGTADVGDVISYQFKVTNTGPTTLTNISVSDPLILVAELPNTDRVQDLIQLASIPSDPVTTASISTSSMGTAAFKFTSFEANVPQWPASLHASRKLINLSGSDLLKAGDRVGVYFTLTNTGDVPLTNISVQQPGSQAFGSALDILARNTSDSASIIYTHVLTDEDITSGQITPMSEISANAPGRTIRQTLNQPLSLLDITTPDELATASITPTVVPTLAPGAETIFTATYNITQNDIDAGHVLNTATAFGTNGMNVVI